MPPPTEAILPALLLSRYLFFLNHRPISASNTHYLWRRIHGLQSLAGLLEDVDGPAGAKSVALLRSLTPTNMHESDERLQLTLSPLVRTSLPATYITADAHPPADFLRGSRRLLLLLGPAIGIGDEVMCFPLPSWIRSVDPAVEITVLTTYEGLWDRVGGVDRLALYQDHRQMLAAMRGESELGAFDVVLLVDFENPELYEAVPAEPGIARYVELAVGARVLVAVDNRRRWVYRATASRQCFANYYDALRRLAASLGLGQGPPDWPDVVPDRRPKAQEGELVVYVSPFTSKYDPSPRYWIRLLETVVSARSPRPVRFVLDVGANLATHAFTADLVRALSGSHNGSPVRFEAAPTDTRQALSLRGVLEQLERAQVVVCADSFTAHAAPVMGCTTLVLAPPGLEDWRVPYPLSFYFDAEAPLDTVVAGMSQVLGHHGVLAPQDRYRPPLGAAERRLVGIGHELSRLLAGADGSETGAICAAYRRFARSRQAVVDRLPTWPAPARGLLGDHAYELPLRPLEADQPVPPSLQPSVTEYVAQSWLRWRNTNLCKYLELALADTGP
jgi:hypothetical protein